MAEAHNAFGCFEFTFFVTIALASLNGRYEALILPRLEEVGRDISWPAGLGHDTVLLPRLSSVGGSLHLAADSCAELDLSQLTAVNGDLSLGIDKCDYLDLEKLINVGGDVSLGVKAGGPTVFNLPGLTTVKGSVSPGGSAPFSWPSLQHVEGDFLLVEMADLSSFDMPDLTTVDGDVMVQSQWRLSSLVGLSSLTTIGGDLVVEEIGCMDTKLVDLAGLESLVSVGGNVSVSEASLVTFGGLPQLESVGGSFATTYVNAERAGSFDQLRFIGGNLAAIGYVEIESAEGELGFPALESIGKDLDATGIRSPNLSMPSLQTVGGHFYLVGNPNVHALSCDSLTTVGRGVLLRWNNGLETVIMPQLTSVGGDMFAIADNPLLSQCDAEDIAAQLVDYQGTVWVMNNGPCD